MIKYPAAPGQMIGEFDECPCDDMMNALKAYLQSWVR